MSFMQTQIALLAVFVGLAILLVLYRPARQWFERRATLQRLLGVLALLFVLYEILVFSNSHARSLLNHQNMAQRLGFYGVLTLGVGVLIISGGIDLSIGSVVGLAAVSLAMLLEKQPAILAFLSDNNLGWLAGILNALWPYAPAAFVVGVAALIGLIHGLFVTKLGLQPFLVTLCGLFIYRGLAQWVTGSRDVGIGGIEGLEVLRFLAVGRQWEVPVIVFLLLGLACFVTVLLHLSVYGRYLYAVGYNEQAARYAGVATDRSKILAYVICSSFAGLGGVLHLLDLGTASPTSTGSWLELYAITGAVLGGCSLRGGEGTVVGMLLGAAVLPLLWTLCNFIRGLNVLQFAVIGTALLLGTITDELLKRRTRAK